MGLLTIGRYICDNGCPAQVYYYEQAPTVLSPGPPTHTLVSVMLQVRDELRVGYDEGRGGFSIREQQQQLEQEDEAVLVDEAGDRGGARARRFSGGGGRDSLGGGRRGDRIYGGGEWAGSPQVGA